MVIIFRIGLNIKYLLMILKLLKSQAQEKANNRTIKDVRIGLCYTAVLLDNGATGVAYTFHHDVPPGCGGFREEKPVVGRKADDIIQYITSTDLIERTVGIATANALINEEVKGLIEADTLEILGPEKEDIVGMVGFFGPLVPQLKTKVKELFIFEKVTERSKEVYPEIKAFDILPTCTIAIITSTTLINQTLEKLLEASRNCNKVALVGASTPLSHELFSPLGVNVLSGVIITNPQAILQVVSEGRGMRFFKGKIKKVNIVVNT